nr:substrate-binding domain-containing protein [Paenibacillus timonensis]
MIIPTLQIKVEQRIVDNIERFAWASGYQLTLSISRESQRNESEAIEAFNRNGVKGMIIFPTEEENYNEDILRLSIDKFPLVLIDRYLKDIRTYSVSADNEKGTFDAVSYLLNQGHREIALISPVITNTVTEDRAAGFERAFYQNQLPINKNQWCILNIDDIHKGPGEKMIYEFFRSHPEITAAFAMNAQLTGYAYKALQRLNKRVPEEFALVGFDGPERPGIHFVQQDIETMCKHTVECLLEQLEGHSNPRRVTVPVELIQ